MNTLLKSILFSGLLFASCGEHKSTESTDNQSDESVLTKEIEAIEKSEQISSDIDSLTSEIDSLLKEVEQF